MFDKLLTYLKMHCFIYMCDQCCCHYNDWCCYCKACITFLRFCKQLYFDSNSMAEDDLEDIVPMTN